MTHDQFLEEQGGALLDKYLRDAATLVMLSDFLEMRLKKYGTSAERDRLLQVVKAIEKKQIDFTLLLQQFAADYMAFVDANQPPPP